MRNIVTNADGNRYVHGGAECYANSYSYTYGQANAYCQAERNTASTAHSTAAPIAFVDVRRNTLTAYEIKTHWSTCPPQPW